MANRAKEEKPETLPISPGALEALLALQREAEGFLTGKRQVTEVILSALLSSGHVLFEDVPGVGKTTVIKAVSKWLGLEMARVQCTSDLLPSDILGVEVFSAKDETFVFHRGPVFSHILLVDELNRASPRTQSALLEAMAEGSVTVSRKSYALPHPFIVFATQNPSDYVGTYPLPESQLDRFSAKLHLSYPVDEKEKEIFASGAVDPLAQVRSGIVGIDTFRELQEAVPKVFASDRVVGLAKKVIDVTRTDKSLKLGVSTRGGVIWLRMARARALLSGRAYVIPDDLLALAVPCLCHRMVARSGTDTQAILEGILGSMDID